MQSRRLIIVEREKKRSRKFWLHKESKTKRSWGWTWKLKCDKSCWRYVASFPLFACYLRSLFTRKSKTNIFSVKGPEAVAFVTFCDSPKNVYDNRCVWFRMLAKWSKFDESLSESLKEVDSSSFNLILIKIKPSSNAQRLYLCQLNYNRKINSLSISTLTSTFILR